MIPAPHLEATPLSDSSVKVSWEVSNTSKEVTGFRLHVNRRIGPAHSRLFKLQADATSHVVNSLGSRILLINIHKYNHVSTSNNIYLLFNIRKISIMMQDFDRIKFKVNFLHLYWMSLCEWKIFLMRQKTTDKNVNSICKLFYGIRISVVKPKLFGDAL